MPRSSMADPGPSRHVDALVYVWTAHMACLYRLSRYLSVESGERPRDEPHSFGSPVLGAPGSLVDLTSPEVKAAHDVELSPTYHWPGLRVRERRLAMGGDPAWLPSKDGS